MSKRFETKLHGQQWWIILGTLVLLPVVCCIIIACSALSILGPWDQPRFENKDWSSLTVEYRLVQEYNKEISREVVISGNDLAELKKLFSTKESVGVSTPCPGFLSLELSNGQRWKIQFGTTNLLRFCLGSNNYYAYAVTLDSTKFYERLRNYCLNSEQKFTPHARIENISICTNRHFVSPTKLSELQSKFVGDFIEVGLRGELSEVCVPVCTSVAIVQEDVLVHEVSPALNPQVSDAISGENSETEQADAK